MPADSTNGRSACKFAELRRKGLPCAAPKALQGVWLEAVVYEGTRRGANLRRRGPGAKKEKVVA